LVARAAQIARSLHWVDAAVLSTDDEEIAQEGRAHGLDVPFRRPAELAGDLSTSVDMWRHAWSAAEDHYGRRFDISTLLEPTSPLRQPADISATVQALLEGDHKAAATVSPAPAHFTPEKCLTVTHGLIGFYHPAGSRHSLRQSIPRYYFRNGICYALKRTTLMDEGRILGEDTAAVVIERPVINIDDPLDLEIAEFLLKRKA
jgi:CMP-N-acetylneuraminic acid synthetase